MAKQDSELTKFLYSQVLMGQINFIKILMWYLENTEIIKNLKYKIIFKKSFKKILNSYNPESNPKSALSSH